MAYQVISKFFKFKHFSGLFRDHKIQLLNEIEFFEKSMLLHDSKKTNELTLNQYLNENPTAITAQNEKEEEEKLIGPKI